MTIPTTTSTPAPAHQEQDKALTAIMHKVLSANGDLNKLRPDERNEYYFMVCKRLGLDETTMPFLYLTTPDKRLILYATRSCGDQLRKNYGITLEIVSRDIADDVLTIHVRARMLDGRSDEDLGAVAFGPHIKGKDRANAELTAVTKAKRRVTLSICGLGFLDETEVEDISGATKVTDAMSRNSTIQDGQEARHQPPPVGANVMTPPPHDPETGEVIETSPPPPPPPPARHRRTVEELAAMAREATRNGTIDGFWPTLTREEFESLKPFWPELQALKAEYLASASGEPKTMDKNGSSPKRRARAATNQPPQPEPEQDQEPQPEGPTFADL